MKFKDFKKIIFVEAEEDAETPPEAAVDPEAELQEKIVKKMDEIGEIASKELNNLIDSKTEIFLNRVRTLGIDEVLENFIIQKFVPSLDNQDDKLFITVNLDDFVVYLNEKFSARLVDMVEKGSGKKEKEEVKENPEKPEEK